jgi:hypothetical protein
MNIKDMKREPVIDKCIGCSRVKVGPEPGPQTCQAYLIPASKWRYGDCPLSDHTKKELAEEKKINPLKKSKQTMKAIPHGGK